MNVKSNYYSNFHVFRTSPARPDTVAKYRKTDTIWFGFGWTSARAHLSIARIRLERCATTFLILHKIV
jgi:hypothetical protein